MTSDLHHNHGNIVKYSKRLQYANKEEIDIITNGSKDEIRQLKISDETVQRMNQGLIENINSRVRQDDILYILGDVSFARDINDTERFLNRINCQHKRLIRGNHDRDNVANLSQWERVDNYEEITINKNKFVLFHYPIASFNGIHKGYYQLHGHCHNNFTLTKQRIDVGVDAQQYFPKLVEELIESAKYSPDTISVDHHD